MTIKKLIEKASENVETLRALKVLFVKLKLYELGAECREIEKNLYPREPEEKDSPSEEELFKAFDFALGYGYHQGFNAGLSETGGVFDSPEGTEKSKEIFELYLERKGLIDGTPKTVDKTTSGPGKSFVITVTEGKDTFTVEESKKGFSKLEIFGIQALLTNKFKLQMEKTLVPTSEEEK